MIGVQSIVAFIDSADRGDRFTPVDVRTRDSATARNRRLSGRKARLPPDGAGDAC